MKFSVSKDKLLEGLSTVQNVVSTRTTLPILSNVLLQAAEGKIRLTTTDLDVGVQGSVEAQVERTGATTLPARRLFATQRTWRRFAAAQATSKYSGSRKKSSLRWLDLKTPEYLRLLKKV
jgi:DNA polymerase III sliding clamp (beta) subunit (PCNA family)